MKRLLAPAVCTLVLVLSSCAPMTQDIYIATSGFTPEQDEGIQLTRVTPPDQYVHWSFDVSPDGERIVYSARTTTSEPYQIFLLNKRSSVPVKITRGGDEDYWDPSFTPDGNHIIFRTGTNFWRIKADGAGARTRIVGSGLNNRDYYPDVSPDGRIVFITADFLTGKRLIWSIGMDGSELTQYREGNHPRWSPCGTVIIFEYERDLWMMNRDGTMLTQLTATEDIVEALPSFSPCGKYIVFASNEDREGRRSGDVNIWYMNRDGSNKTQITSLASWDSWPHWGADGIYFLSGRASGDKDMVRIWKWTPPASLGN